MDTIPMANLSACGIPNFSLDDGTLVTVQFATAGDGTPHITFPTKLTPAFFWGELGAAVSAGAAVHIVVTKDEIGTANQVDMTVF